MGMRREAGFARRIALTPAGRAHPLLKDRPSAFDAPAVHTDEVEELAPGGTLLASNEVTRIQTAEIRHDGGVFWGVQYHPEIPLCEVAAALRRQASDLIEHQLARSEADVEVVATAVDDLADAPECLDLLWRRGLTEQVADFQKRTIEIRNFIDLMVRPSS
jgi:GMP synthase (glutamine-hydrolysing)